MTTPSTSFPYLPTPRTWSAGDVIKAPLLRTDVSGAIQLLAHPPMLIGQQTGASQSITNNNYTEVTIDTELYDNLGGHQLNANTSRYYGMFAGWYLCESTSPFFVTAAGTSIIANAVGGVQNGGAATNYGGSRIPATASNPFMPVAAKLMHMVNVGTVGGGSNDYIYGAAFQTNGGAGAQSLDNNINIFPTMSFRWVCASSGTEPLAVPANPAWPIPTSFITSSFMNTNVRNAIEFLIYPPIFEYVRTGGGGALASTATLSATTGATVGLDTLVVDNYSAWNGGTNTWTAPVAGCYYVYGCVAVNAQGTADTLAVGVTVTSANYNGGTAITLWMNSGASATGTAAAQAGRKRLRLNAGDTIQLAAAQHDTAATTLTYSTTAHEPRMIIVWESA